ncbi:MAG: cation-translocating P-type ATPase, partial [Planctomycetes bacterium]|nr:cation-translocating P-type ATPase [Planctomycetota bacterium]
LAVEAALGDRENMGFSSAIVTYGRGKGIVTATGMATEVGRIAAMLQSVPDTKTPLQSKIDQLGKYLGIAAVAVCVVIFAAGMLQGRNLLEMFMVAVSLAAAAIPEGLPAVSTIVLAVGVQRLARQNAIVRDLPSVETLGSATVVCSDKTGTLTQNRMTVVKLAVRAEPARDAPTSPDALGDDEKQLLLAAVMANDATLSREGDGWKTAGDPTETAFVELGATIGLDKNRLEEEQPRVAEVPFDSERKMMSTINRRADGGYTIYVKGGVEEILARCGGLLANGTVQPLDDGSRQEIRRQNELMASQALRVLAGAYRRVDTLPETIDSAAVENELIFCGMAGMMDPPRPEVRDAVAKCRTAGIKPVMITGDHMVTAIAIAESLGIKQPGDLNFTGAELEKTSDAELAEQVEKTAVYARVAPEHKVRIVKAFQKNGEIVGMTGDGVNDAPALKLADIGLAMGITGTDVSKGAADVVLADDNFATIVKAVEEGRRIYDNILKAIQFMLSTNLGEILVIFTAIMLRWPTPLLPIQILWINLVTDSLPALALSVDPADADIMSRPPIKAEKGLMDTAFLLRIILQGIMIAGLSLAAFRIGYHTDVATGQTMTFAVLALAQITHVLNVRTSRYSAFRHLFSNRLLLGALVVVLGMMLIVLEIPYLHDFFHLAPLTTAQWEWIVVLSLAPLPIVEAVKLAVRLFWRKAPNRAAGRE